MSGIAVTRVRHGNDDLLVINAARCSFSKHHDVFLPQDAGLLRFLIRNSHWSPPSHPHLLLRRSMPLVGFARYMAQSGAGHRVEIAGWERGMNAIEFLEAGSLWFHLRNLAWAPPIVVDVLAERFPESWAAFAELTPDTGMRADRGSSLGQILEDLTFSSTEEELASLRGCLGPVETSDAFVERLATITFHLSVPVFVARQLEKHRIELVMNGEIEESEPAQNEVSRRYIDALPELYWPDRWRKRAPDKKQGSLDEAVGMMVIGGIGFGRGGAADFEIISRTIGQVELYRDMIASHVAPEQARMILPQNVLTEFFWSGSVAAFRRVCDLRLKKDAQEETRRVAALIAAELDALRPSASQAPA